MNGGEGGIRTLGTLARSLDFESSPFGHSGTSPKADSRLIIKRKSHMLAPQETARVL